MKFEKLFSRFAQAAAHQVGRPGTFVFAIFFVILWSATGKFFNYSESWRGLLDTVIAVITFLLVLLLQNSQTRDTRAIQAKLDELIQSHDRGMI